MSLPHSSNNGKNSQPFDASDWMPNAPISDDEQEFQDSNFNTVDLNPDRPPAQQENPSHKPASPPPINYGAHLNPSMLTAALNYARLGVPVHPLHSVENGVCSCRQGSECGKNAGKHPRLSGWQEHATTNEATIKKWWRQYPQANIGCPQGAKYGTFQLDVDNDAGQAYVDEQGLPACPTIKTGKGHRYVFAHPGEKIKSRSRIVPGRKDIGLDVQAYGANTVLPPSVHYSGVRYQWVDGRKLSDFPDGPPEAPEWVLDLVYQRKKGERPLFADPPRPTVAAPRQKEVDLPPHQLGRRGACVDCGKPTRKPYFERCHACHANERREAWCAGALAQSLEKLARATEGSLNNTLRDQAYFIGMLVGAGHLTQSEAESLIERDAPHIFRTNRNKGISTMTRALEAGARNPSGLDMPDFDDHAPPSATNGHQQPPPQPPEAWEVGANDYHQQPPPDEGVDPYNYRQQPPPDEWVDPYDYQHAPPPSEEWEQRRQTNATINQRRMSPSAHAKDVAAAKKFLSRIDKSKEGRQIGEALKGALGSSAREIWHAWSGQPDMWEGLAALPDGLRQLAQWADQDDPPYTPPVAEFTFDELKAKIEQAIGDQEVTKHDLAAMIDDWTESAAHLKGREVNRLCKLLKKGKVTARSLQHWRADIKEVQEEIKVEKEENEKKQSVTGAILDALDSLGYTFRLNECNGHIEVNGENLEDALAAKIRSQMRDLGFKSMPAIEDAYIMHAYDCRYHPLKDWLRGLCNQWDGVDYIGYLASHFTDSHEPVVCDDGVKRSLTHVYLQRWAVGAVAKVFGDGKAQNQCIVFEGKQGIGKSYMARWLAGVMPDYFIEDEVKPSNKDHKLRLTDNWIWEIAELGATTRKADVEALKHFITTGTIKVRPPYGRYAIHKPAVTSFFGTVNDDDGFLRDRTGNRRFWVVSIVDVDKRYSKRIKPEQIWAQAVALYLAGETGELTEIEIEARETNNTRYQVTNPVEDWIFRYFKKDPDGFTSTTDIVKTLQNKGYRGQTRSIQMDVSSTLRSLGFEKAQVTVDGKQRRGFYGISKIKAPRCPLCGQEESKTFFKFRATKYDGGQMWHCKLCHNPQEDVEAFWSPDEIERN